MNKHRSRMIGLLAITLASAAATLAPAQDVKVVHVGLSPYMSDWDRGVVSNQVLNLVGTVPAGTRLVFEDAWNLQTIATFEIPRLKSDRPGVRARFLKGPLAQLLSWLERVGREAESAPEGVRGSAVLRLPEYLAFVTQQAASEPRSILLIGSPLYQSPTESSYSFGEDRFPSDACLFCDPAGSIFSVVRKRDRLRNTRVFFLYPGEGLFRSELYKDCVARFWNLFVTYQGGVMACFHADAERTFAMLTKADLPPVRRDAVNPSLTKPEMLSITREIPWRMITNEVGEVKYEFEPPPRPVEAEQRVLRDLEQTVADHQTAIGIMWSIRGLDLDLWVWPQPEADPLFFRNTRTPEGRYIYDYRDKNEGLDYEKVLLERSADLSRVKAFVNFYAGSSAGPVEGKLFLRHQGRTFMGKFNLAARTGNEAAQVATRSSSPFWTELALPSLIEEPSTAHAGR